MLNQLSAKSKFHVNNDKFKIFTMFLYDKMFIGVSYILSVTHLSDYSPDTSEREARFPKAHLPTAQIRTQQLQYQTHI